MFESRPLGTNAVEIPAEHCGIFHSDVSMLQFAVCHQIKPVTEHFPFDRVNEAIGHLDSGQARYRIVLDR